MKTLILQHLASMFTGGVGAWALLRTYGLPFALKKLGNILQHENPYDKALLIAVLTWLRSRGVVFGLSIDNVHAIEEKALAGIPEPARGVIEDLVDQAIEQAAKDILAAPIGAGEQK
jgi:hypothetical protein